MKKMKAEDISEKIFKDFDMMETFEHSKRVKEICIEISNELDIEKTVNIEKSACLHDVGKVIKVKGHDHNDKKVVKKVFKMYEYSDDELKDIIEIISCHRGDFKPPKGLRQESAILRLADKLDKFDKAIGSYKKTIKKIKKRPPDSIHKLEKICIAYMKEKILELEKDLKSELE